MNFLKLLKCKTRNESCGFSFAEKEGKGFPVGIRISQAKVNNYTHKWADGEKDAEIIFGHLCSAGIDFIHVTEFHADAPAFGETGPTLASLAKKNGENYLFWQMGI